MDVRKPKEAIPRIKELIAQYQQVILDMDDAIVSQDISSLERQGLLIVQEICMTAPLLHDALMVYSQESRKDLRNRTIARMEQERMTEKMQEQKLDDTDAEPKSNLNDTETMPEPTPEFTPVTEPETAEDTETKPKSNLKKAKKSGSK